MTAPAIPTLPLPGIGGSYIRDPQTGALTPMLSEAGPEAIMPKPDAPPEPDPAPKPRKAKE